MADILVKIGNLLRKAERTDSDAERDALLDKAQQLSTTYSIDLAMARKATADKEKRQVPVARQIVIGQRGKMGLSTYVGLFLAIGYVQGLKFDIAHNSTYVIAYGFPQDIAVTEAIYATVLPQMIQESDAFMRSGRYKDEKVWRRGTFTRTDYYGNKIKYVDWGYFPVHGKSARMHFQAEFAARIQARLALSKHTATEQAVASKGTGAEIALRAAEVEIQDLYQKESTAKGKYRGSRMSDGGVTARQAGAEAGRRARIGTEPSIGGHRKAVGA